MQIVYSDSSNRITKKVWILQYSDDWAGPNCITQVRTKKDALKKARSAAVRSRRRVDVSYLDPKYLDIHLQFSAFQDGTISYV
jgi:hypothetical protein